jgi:hypothetical protein
VGADLSARPTGGRARLRLRDRAALRAKLTVLGQHAGRPTGAQRASLYMETRAAEAGPGGPARCSGAVRRWRGAPSYAPPPRAGLCQCAAPAASVRAPPQRPAPPGPGAGQRAISLAWRGEAADQTTREIVRTVAEGGSHSSVFDAARGVRASPRREAGWIRSSRRRERKQPD